MSTLAFNDIEKFSSFANFELQTSLFVKWLYFTETIKTSIKEDYYWDLVAKNYDILLDEMEGRILSNKVVKSSDHSYWLGLREKYFLSFQENLKKSFSNVDRTNAVSLMMANAKDDRKSDEEINEAEKLDTDIVWTDIPAQKIEHFGEVLHFLDAKGLRYYLPAYMRWAINNTNTSSDTISTLLFVIDNIKLKKLDLTNDQTLMVFNFFWYLLLYCDDDTNYYSTYSHEILTNSWYDIGSSLQVAGCRLQKSVRIDHFCI